MAQRIHPIKRIPKALLRRSVRFLASKKLITPRTAARWLHFEALGRFPDLRNPRDLNEKILWMEFHSDTSQWPRLADKVAVRDYVTEKGLSDLLIPIYGVYDSADQINPEAIPVPYVLKSNNGSAQAIFVADKEEWAADRIRAMAADWLKSRFGLAGAEPHYLRIPPRVYAEKMLPLPPDGLLTDYKFFCFDGKPLYCMVCTDRNPETFHCNYHLFSLPDWKYLKNAVRHSYRSTTDIPVPEHLKEMMQHAATLSKDLPFARVDLYDVTGKVYFGEITLTPLAGRIAFFTRDILIQLGNLINL